jgi:hypothetical protein
MVRFFALKTLIAIWLFLAVFASNSAYPYQASSEITWTAATESITGNAKTWKDPWDADAYSDCVLWVWDDFYGYYCYQYSIQINSVQAIAVEKNNEGAIIDTRQDTDFQSAEASYGHTALAHASRFGTWSSTGTHNVIAETFMLICPYGFCYGPIPTGTYPFSLGSTSDQTILCAANDSTVDSAAIVVGTGWPAEPWERAVTMMCGTSGNVTYTHFADSFGTIYGFPTNDPCASEVIRGPGVAAELHSHPFFSTLSEYLAGLACHEHSSPPYPTPAELTALNILNSNNFSEEDILGAAGRNSYLRVYDERILKISNLIPAYSPEQVYP